MNIKLIFLPSIVLRSIRELRGKKEEAVEPKVHQMQLATIISQIIFRMNISLLSQLPHLLNGIYGTVLNNAYKCLITISFI